MSFADQPRSGQLKEELLRVLHANQPSRLIALHFFARYSFLHCSMCCAQLIRPQAQGKVKMNLPPHVIAKKLGRHRNFLDARLNFSFSSSQWHLFLITNGSLRSRGYWSFKSAKRRVGQSFSLAVPSKSSKAYS